MKNEELRARIEGEKDERLKEALDAIQELDFTELCCRMYDHSHDYLEFKNKEFKSSWFEKNDEIIRDCYHERLKELLFGNLSYSQVNYLSGIYHFMEETKLAEKMFYKKEDGLWHLNDIEQVSTELRNEIYYFLTKEFLFIKRF